MSSQIVQLEPLLWGCIKDDSPSSGLYKSHGIVENRYDANPNLDDNYKTYAKFSEFSGNKTLKINVTHSEKITSLCTASYANVMVNKLATTFDESVTYGTSPESGEYIGQFLVPIGGTGEYTLDIPYCEKGYVFTTSNYLYVSFSTCTLEYTSYTPEVGNIEISGTSVDEDIKASFSLEDTSSYVFEVIKDDAVVYTKNGTSDTSKTVPANTLPGSGNYTFKVTATKDGNVVEKTTSKTLTCTSPVIKSASLSKSNVERGTSITLNVSGTNITGYTADILSGSDTVSQNVGNNFSTSNLEARNYKVKVKAYYTNGKYTTTCETTVNFTVFQLSPEITSKTLSSSNVEKGTTISSTCTGTNITGYTINILDSNSNLISSSVGTKINTSVLAAGDYKAQFIAYYSNSAYTAYSQATTVDFSVFTYNADITSVEPNAITELRSKNIQLAFSAKNFTNYSISAVQGGITKWNYSGTNSSSPNTVTTKTFSMIKNLFSEGEVTVSVQISNVKPAYTKTDTLTVTFTAIDNPATPVITCEQTYSTPKPTVHYQCSSQYISYKIEIDGVESSEIFAVTENYYFSTPLSNNAYHTFKIKVKNKYSLWSEWASATFKIEYAELNTPDFNVYADLINGCICIAMESEEQTNFHNHSVLRMENSTWTEIGKDLDRVCTFIDNSCSSSKEYYYKVRAYDIFGGYKDTGISPCSVELNETILSAPWTNEKIKLEYYQSESDLSKQTSLNSSDKYVEVCGLTLPKLQCGTSKYNTLTLNVAFKTKQKYDEFMQFIDDNKIILFRDRKGTKMYAHIIPKATADYIYFYKCICVEITEVYYKEGDYSEVKDTTFTWSTEEW